MSAHPQIIRPRKVWAVNDNTPQSAASEYQRGRAEGWSANNEYRKDKQELTLVVNAPGGNIALAIALAVFGTLFAYVDARNAYRFNYYDFGLIMLAAVPLTAAFFMFRSIPKRRREAKLAEEQFRAKWSDVK